MRRVILHIGRQKTGTTAIQRFLYANSTLLNSHNIYYPKYGTRGFGHHEIGGPISHIDAPRFWRKSNSTVSEIRVALLNDIQDRNSLIVISSESFQNCDPRWVGQLLSGFQVDVVVYLREQVAFLASAYAQKIQTSNYCGSLEEFMLGKLSLDYLRFLEAWSGEFPSNITVKTYEKSELIQGDIVVDFCESILHLPGDTVKSLCEESDPNPTLTSDLIEFKLCVNRQCTLSPEQEKTLYFGLAELSSSDKSGKVFVPPYLIDELNKRHHTSNRKIAQTHFNRQELFARFSQPEKTEFNIALESRLLQIRDKLVSMHPQLKDSLAELM